MVTIIYDPDTGAIINTYQGALLDPVSVTGSLITITQLPPGNIYDYKVVDGALVAPTPQT